MVMPEVAANGESVSAQCGRIGAKGFANQLSHHGVERLLALPGELLCGFERRAVYVKGCLRGGLVFEC